MSRLKLIDGKPCFDAKKPIVLHITKQDVARANVKKPDTCAVAQTCLRKKGVKEVRIHLSRAYVRFNATNWQRFMVPTALRSEIVSFDRGGRFSPGDYSLYAPEPSKKLGADKRKRPSAPKGNRRRKYHQLTDVRSGPA